MLILSQNGGLKTDFAVICRSSRQGQRERSASSTAWCRRCENENRFRIRGGGCRGVSRGNSCPHASALRLRRTGKAAKSADFRQPGMPEIHCILVQACYPALAFLTVKTAEKVSSKKLLPCPNACRQRRKKAVMRPPSRCQPVVKGSVRRYRRQCQMKLRLSWSG